MGKYIKYIISITGFLTILSIVWLSKANNNNFDLYHFNNPTEPDSLKYPLQSKDPIAKENNNPLYLKNPKNVTTSIEYDPKTNQYIAVNKIGDNEILGSKKYISFQEYVKQDFDNSIQNYWKEKTASSSDISGSKGLPLNINLPSEFGNIFGSNKIDIRPTGSAELIFAVNSNRRDDPSLDERQRRITNFDFQEKIQLNVTAKIGDKIQLGTNYNTEASFEFENKMKLEYEGKEDEIIKKIEAGDVSLPLTGSLITGSQALFGIKSQLQFGKTTVTTVISQQKSKSSTIEVSGGAQKSLFEIKADEYDENRHFFIGHYFRNHYEEALSKLPIINSPINITKIEVWVTSTGPALKESRNIIAFQDLGESNPQKKLFKSNFTTEAPNNNANSLYEEFKNNTFIRNINTLNTALSNNKYDFTSGSDYEKIENARKLSSNEFTFNSKLGFISLNAALDADEVLAVAYQYTLIGDTVTYQVGEFSNGPIAAPNNLIVKLLKSTSPDNKQPSWDLMMKNVYSIGAYQVNKEDFRLNILYANDESGIPSGYISEGAISGQPLIRVLNLDNLNTQMDPISDGVFDFIDGANTNGGTINASNGKIYFPVLEPFGSYLSEKINDPKIAAKYAYTALYDSSKTIAQQYPEKNKFYLSGSYKSSVSSDISLNSMNVPQNSVVVTSGGIKLTENVDYTVDYALGRVKIINEGVMNSGNPIRISLESNELFNIQTKTLLGIHADHKISKDFTIGASMLRLTERPLTQKVNIGDDPIANTIWGIDGTYRTSSRLVTKMLDKLPFYGTKEESNFTLSGEFAQLIPGHARAIGKGSQGTSYIDDFEGSKSSIDIKTIGAWQIASTPQGQTDQGLFPETSTSMGLKYGYNRAKIAWYVIDRLFNDFDNRTPEHIKTDKNQQSNHYVRGILETEVFPNADPPNGQSVRLAVLNLAYYPNEKGPYNYDVNPINGLSYGINELGKLNNPSSRWAGIMRKIESSDFEATNIEYIEFWMMDPFAYSNGEDGNPLHSGGDLYFNIGDISEDILKDSRKSYENGLPNADVNENIDTTIWGKVPTVQALVNTFDNNPQARQYQDVGLDGLSDKDELVFHKNYLNQIASKYGTNSSAYSEALKDPSSDNYHYYQGSDYDSDKKPVLDRYKMFNGLEGNSPTSEQSPEPYPTQATTMPDIEDINLDNTLNENERYFQYRIHLKPEEMKIGSNYITDIQEASINLKNNTIGKVKWYQFKVPINNPEKIIGNIRDFKSIRFMRIYLKNFNEPIILRFATLELVRSEWRKYKYSLMSPGEYIANDNLNDTQFDLSAVNIEENGEKSPIPYKLPPQIERERTFGTTALQRMNEQSLVLKVCNLQDGDARAVYKNTDFDLRRYGKLNMFIHAEAIESSNAIKKGDLTAFIRLGTDFNNNYYEYEVPLEFTNWHEEDPEKIWPKNITINLDLSKLQEIKQQRNIELRKPESKLSISQPYIQKDSANTIIIMGMPNLSQVKTIMIGIRNPKQINLSNDDGLSKCAEIWINELRLTDFDEKGGWAANARISGNLADLGSISLAGHMSTPGFGGIEQKLDERSKNNTKQYDVATSLELGKFLPEKSGLTIPMHIDYSEAFINPEYMPSDPDIKFNDAIKTYSSPIERDSIIRVSQDYTKRKSINFINVKKNKTNTSSNPHFYDISNFDISYAYTEMYHSNIETEYDLQKTYRGALGYNFVNNPKNYQPLGKIKFLKKTNYLKLLSDFNFYLAPKLFSFRTDIDRQYAEALIRNTSQANLLIEPTFVKNFAWNRQYAFKYDLSKSLKLDINANNQARIDEPFGRIDKNDNDYEEKKNEILNNIKQFGRTTNYNHDISLNYTVPINKIPILDWTNVSLSYRANFRWQAAALSATELGNSIENANDKQINGTFNFNRLYDKVKYFKDIRTPKKNNQIQINKKTPAADSTEEEAKINYAKLILDNTIKLALSLQNVSISYSETNGTFLPGYLPNTNLMGYNFHDNAPLPGFIVGWQYPNIAEKAGKSGWISKDTMLNTAYANTYAQKFSGRATIEPLKDLKINLTANRNFTRNEQKYYKANAQGEFASFSPSENGNLTMSFIAIKTIFKKDNDKHISPVFEAFRKNRREIAYRLANKNKFWDKGEFIDTLSNQLFPNGYGPNAQDVVIPAFIAAYSGSSPSAIALETFPQIPLPNWQFTYNGLGNLELFKKYFKSFTLGHGYRCNFNIGSYVSNINFTDPDSDGFTRMREELGYMNFLSRYEIGQISLSEQFSPLINFDMTWKNSLMTRIEYKKSRDLSLSLTNNQLTEINGNEIVIGLGYKIKDVKFNVNAGGRKKQLKSDLNIISNISIRTNKTTMRRLVEDVNLVSSGQRIISINTSADYQINQRFTIRAFFDKIINNPFVNNLYPNSNTNAGISLRFSLAQ